MKSVLTRLNHRLSTSNRSILSLMDNAGCQPHPVSLDGKGRAHAWHGTRGKTQSI